MTKRRGIKRRRCVSSSLLLFSRRRAKLAVTERTGEVLAARIGRKRGGRNIGKQTGVCRPSGVLPGGRHQAPTDRCCLLSPAVSSSSSSGGGCSTKHGGASPC